VSINHHTNCTKIAIGIDVKIVKNIPEEVTNGKSYIRIKFESEEGSIAGRVFGLKIISEEI